MYSPIISINSTSLMILINLFILYLILKKFFFEKIKAFMDARRDKVVKTIEHANELEAEAGQKLDEYNEKLDGASAECIQMKQESRDSAAKLADRIVEEAHEEAEKIKSQALKEIEFERKRSVEEMKREISSLAIMAAEQIIKENLDEDKQQQIVNKVIEDSEMMKWQN